MEQFKEPFNVTFCFCKLFHKWNKSFITKRDSIKSIIGIGKVEFLDYDHYQSLDFRKSFRENEDWIHNIKWKQKTIPKSVFKRGISVTLHINVMRHPRFQQVYFVSVNEESFPHLCHYCFDRCCWEVWYDLRYRRRMEKLSCLQCNGYIIILIN